MERITYVSGVNSTWSDQQQRRPDDHKNSGNSGNVPQTDDLQQNEGAVTETEHRQCSKSVLEALRCIETVKLGVYHRVRPPSNLQVSLTTQAAVFNIHCSLLVIVGEAAAKMAFQHSTGDITKA